MSKFGGGFHPDRKAKVVGVGVDLNTIGLPARHSAMERYLAQLACADWALEQPDPEDALRELLGALGLNNREVTE
jgi:hypothetical protein